VEAVTVVQVVLAVVGLICLTVLVSLGEISGEVAIPIISAVIGGGLGHLNGAAAAKRRNGATDGQ
jgi:hypothetical protein